MRLLLLVTFRMLVMTYEGGDYMATKWWQEAIIYQIYPKSFKDSNNDSVGDIPGITSQLDYIKSIGVNTLWLNPIFISPQVDNGYDISNYYAIDPLFGTEDELTEFIGEAHKRELKIIFDLVLNHTSTQHPWFYEASKSPDNIYRDYYIWEKGRGELPPNNWASFFGGSVWEKDKESDDYYFHLFDKEMPDLNWENPEVRHAMLDIAKYWLSKGIDGFRLDAFIHLDKADFSLQVPNIPEGQVAIAEEYYANLPKVKEYLSYFISELRAIKPDLFILGEAASANEVLAKEYTDPENNQCDTVVSFRYFPEELAKPDRRLPLALQQKQLAVKDFKATMLSWQARLNEERYPTLYWNNHDMPRLVSRFGDVTAYRDASAKMLATLMYLQRGLPIILYGEELGMKNVVIDDIEVFQDPGAKDYFNEMLAEGVTKEEALEIIASVNKEASRGAMQWNTEGYAGFSEVEPWSDVNVEEIYNVASQLETADSILRYYQRLMKLKQQPLFNQAEFRLLETTDDTYVYQRKLADKSGLIACNLSQETVVIDLPKSMAGGQVLLNSTLYVLTENQLELPAYGAVVIIN